MAAPKPKAYKCLTCRLSTTLPLHVRKPQTLPTLTQPSASSTSKRTFTTNPRPLARRRPAHTNIKASDPALQTPATREYAPYTAREKQLLALKYTPQQMRVIEAGEAAISAEDMRQQGRMRTDPMRIRYPDDFASMRPVLDRGVEASDLEGRELVEGQNDTSGSGKSPALPATPAPVEEPDPRMLRLSQQTGLTKQAISRLRIKNLVSHRVVNQTRMGKIQSLYYLTIAGNQDGMVGIGEGKAAEDEDGRRQAMMNAVRNMKPIARYEERTIYGEVEGKVGATVVKLSSRPPGFGNRCQHLIFELARAAGISDLAARTPRSRNKMNVVKAAFQALTSQRLPEEVARGRGRKMVDARAVYYGGQVL